MTTQTVTGNIAQAFEVKKIGKGTAAIEFRLIENRGRRTDEGWVDETPNSYAVRVYGDMAEHVAASVSQGHRVTVTGEIRTDHWQDKNTGEDRYKQYIVAHDVSASMRFTNVLIPQNGPKRGDRDAITAPDGWRERN